MNVHKNPRLTLLGGDGPHRDAAKGRWIGSDRLSRLHRPQTADDEIEG
jgi:hypothetical protein